MSQQKQEQNEKKHNYFYKITNLINGKFYYGIHSTNNLNDGYMGGGTLLRYAQKKYGIENFIKEIIADYPTRKEASDREKQVVTQELIEMEECYNIKSGGDRTDTVSGETRKKQSERMSGENHPNWGKKLSKETCEKISKARKGKTVSVETRQLISENTTGEKNHFFGKTHTIETKEKMSQAQKEYFTTHPPKKLSEDHIQKLKEFNTGRKLSKETIEKRTESRKNYKVSQETKEKMSNSHLGHSHSPGIACIIEGVEYRSLNFAAKTLNISDITVKNRILSSNPEWNNWKFANE